MLFFSMHDFLHVSENNVLYKFCREHRAYSPADLFPSWLGNSWGVRLFLRGQNLTIFVSPMLTEQWGEAPASVSCLTTRHRIVRWRRGAWLLSWNK